MKNIVIWLTAVLIGILLAGCSTNSGNNTGLRSNTSLRVIWDIAVRDLTAPPNVNSVIVKVYRAIDSVELDQATSNRPVAGNITTVAFFGLPIETLRFTISAYSRRDGTGELLSSSELAYTPVMGMNQLTINMHAVPKSLSASPSSLQFDSEHLDMTKFVDISGLDNIDDAIIFNQGELEYSILDTSVATLEQINATRVIITPRAVGTTKLQVKSTIPGVNIMVEVPINVTTMQIASSNINPNSLSFLGGEVDISATITGGTPSKVEAEISGGIYSVPQKITLVNGEGGYSGTWKAPANTTTTGVSSVYAVKIIATTDGNNTIEHAVGNVTVNAPEPPPDPLN